MIRKTSHKTLLTTAALCFAILFSGCATLAPKEPKQKSTEKKEETENSPEGRWFEIGRYPHSFEAGQSNSIVTIKLNDKEKGSIRIKRFDEDEGKWVSDKAKASYFSKEGGKNRVKIQVFWFLRITYQVRFPVDRNPIEHVVISNLDKEHLWLMARKPEVSEDVYKILVEQAKKMGFDPDRIQRVDQQRHLELDYADK